MIARSTLIFEVVAGLAVVALLARALRARLGAGWVTLEMTDPATRMFNQHGLRFLAMGEMRRSVKRNAPCSGMLMEIDHQALLDEEAMYTMAQALNRTLRASDVAARLEGGRFFVLLPGADEFAAEVAMERVRGVIDRDGESPLIACATLRGDGLTIDTLVSACEQKIRRMRPVRQPQIELVPHQVEMGGAQVQPSNV